jgi:D-sedoheptulose 7-phosphate isomerase
MLHITKYFEQAVEICQKIPAATIEKLAHELSDLRERHGRLFILGVGGSAANASHAVNDFRKLCGIETYAPTDNVSELTARTNDEGWETVFVSWLKVSNFNQNDAILVLSVGGGDLEKNVSPNLVHALKEAKERKVKIFGIVGRDGGYTAQVADVAVIIPTVDASHVTPHAEAFQAVVWHCLVSHPKLQIQKTKW